MNTCGLKKRKSELELQNNLYFNTRNIGRNIKDLCFHGVIKWYVKKWCHQYYKNRMTGESAEDAELENVMEEDVLEIE